MELRYYQDEAYNAAVTSLNEGYNPVLQLATGTGKSIILSAIAQHYAQQGLNVWILTHVQQLVSQNAITYKKFTGEHPGIVCSGLAMADYGKPVTFATVQSVKAPAMERLIDDPNIIIIDEAHRVPHNTGDAGLYDSIFREYPNCRKVGMSATPWRLDNGLIYGKGSQYWFDRLAYTYTVPDAVRDGYLCPLVGVETEYQLNLEDVTVNGDEFVQKEVDIKVTDDWMRAVAESVFALANKRHHIAIYCPTIKSASKMAKIIASVTGWSTDLITGSTSRDERNAIFDKMYSGDLRVLCSVDTITTGFDFPPLDCIVCLRPTLSSSLWVQIQGRGTRLHDSKKNCLVLDYVGNYQRLGGVDMLDTYVREKGLDVVEEIPATEVRKPYVKTERRVLPGVRSLKVIDPMTGEEVKDGATLKLKVNSFSAVPIQTRRQRFQVLLAQYACTTPENARIDASLFINTEMPKGADYAFFKNRQLAVYLPSPASKLIWQVRNSNMPEYILARKNGRYWNVVEELFA